MADKIMVIRHAEKPNGLPGVDASGLPDDNSLTRVGWARAHALVAFFDPPRGVVANARLAKPTKLFASVPNATSQSRRPIETVTPLSQDLKAQIDQSYGEGDEKALAKAAKDAAGVVLIAWHHEKIPKLAEHILGSADGVPHKWDPSRFDLVWVFDRDAAGAWSFNQIPQLVMPGDSPAPIPVDFDG